MFLEWNLAWSLPLPGGDYGRQLSLGSSSASARFSSAGPTGDVVDLAACDFLDAIQRGGVWICKHDQSNQDIIEPVTVVCNGVFVNHGGATAAIELLKDGMSLFKTDPFVLAEPIDCGYLRYHPQDAQRVTLLPGSYLCRYWLNGTVMASKPFTVTENHG